MKKQIFFALLLMLFITPFVLGQDASNLTYNQTQAINTIKTKINNVTSLVSLIGGAIATLSASVVGVMMMQTKDPSERDQLKERLKYIIIGGVIIVVAPQIVKFLF